MNIKHPIANAGLLLQFFILIGVCTMVQFSYSFMNPFLQAHFNLDKQQLGLLAAASSGGNLIFSLVSGVWVDSVDFKKAMFTGAGLIGGAALLFTLAASYYMVLVLTFVIGVGYSIILPLTNKRVARLFPADRQSFAIGLKQSGAPLGTAAGSTLLPLLSIHCGWQYAYMAMFVSVLAVAMVVGGLYRTFPAGREGFVDVGVKFSTEPATARSAYRRVYNSRNQSLIVVSNIFIGMSFSITQVIAMTFLVPFYHEQMGIPLIRATTLLGVVQLAGALARPGMGWLADCCVGRKRQVLGVLGLCNAAILIALGWLRHNPGWPALCVLSILLGATAMGWFGPVYSLMIDEMGPGRAGKASGLVATFNLIGMTLAAPFFGYLYERVGNYQLPLWFFALLMLAATLLFLTVCDPRREVAD
ncbi:MFS transporter [Desulfallas sp. Bu1-1]|uniref:MFS transporter n=1 Tax=Desulfallas sp. Bu1-1 TaxID=2787620 RepID=UPI0018A0DA18|nr:MFS transporter [Desulfallas sp. Bu1-1]MBF7084608.1 MFS transporter [Desulfallas sp. Bu1-1]